MQQNNYDPNTLHIQIPEILVSGMQMVKSTWQSRWHKNIWSSIWIVSEISAQVSSIRMTFKIHIIPLHHSNNSLVWHLDLDCIIYSSSNMTMTSLALSTSFWVGLVSTGKLFSLALSPSSSVFSESTSKAASHFSSSLTFSLAESEIILKWSKY